MTKNDERILRLLNNITKKDCTNKFIFNTINFELAPAINISFCNFNIRNFNPNYYDDLSIFCPDRIKKSVLKRQAEFLAGRYTAKQALMKTNSNALYLKTNILIGQNRSPVWPSGILGSITHTDEAAVSIVASSLKYIYLGIDLENIMPLKLALEIQNSILNNIESLYLRTLPIPLNKAITLAFSAKESLFKALYLHIQRYFDFDVAFISKINVSKKLIYMSLKESFIKKHKVPRNYLIRYEASEKHVITFIFHKLHDKES